MGEVVRFVPKAELERARLIREARVIYEYIFPPADQAAAWRQATTPRGEATPLRREVTAARQDRG